eukprot:CAMPEP_0182582382 /NCGR_PEP_ID=MMETSP1324-20130603/52404_1 /TAXON_ID=236786 /ORGANISM="Florenciella sp., Strain RCC1587" /LENGTH=178 /DNA_ID=CAMNT_0024798835 /DNA_START=644 /DNA_END=1176 /DNA_ORIENTATION=+
MENCLVIYLLCAAGGFAWELAESSHKQPPPPQGREKAGPSSPPPLFCKGGKVSRDRVVRVEATLAGRDVGAVAGERVGDHILETVDGLLETEREAASVRRRTQHAALHRLADAHVFVIDVSVERHEAVDELLGVLLLVDRRVHQEVRALTRFAWSNWLDDHPEDVVRVDRHERVGVDE